MRTDRSLSFYDGDDNPNVCLLRDILLTYSFYNFDLGYCQVICLSCPVNLRSWLDVDELYYVKLFLCIDSLDFGSWFD